MKNFSASEFKEFINKTLYQKVAVALDNRKREVASRFFEEKEKKGS